MGDPVDKDLYSSGISRPEMASAEKAPESNHEKLCANCSNIEAFYEIVSLPVKTEW